MNVRSIFCHVVSVLAAMSGLSGHAAVIETLPSWDGALHISALGAGSSTYGQTFLVPESAYLVSWTFYVRDSSLPGVPNQTFDALLARWSNDRAVAPILFEEKGLSVPDSDRGQFYEVTLNVGNVLLEGGLPYVMFLNTSDYPTSGQRADLAATPNVFTDGAFWYQLSNNRMDNVFEYPWTCADEGTGCRYGDSAFRAITSPVPEPSSIALAIAAFGVFAIARRWRRANHNCVAQF